MRGRIGLFVFNLSDEYYGRFARETEGAAHRAGFMIEVFDAKNAATKQAQDIMAFSLDRRDERRCALVVPLADAIDRSGDESDPTFRLARRVLQKGVGWVSLNHGRESLVARLRFEFPDLLVAMVVIDNVEFGRIHARQLRRLLPKGGRVLCVRGNPQDSASRDRCLGMQEALRETAITVDEVDGRWQPRPATDAVRDWISSPLRKKMPLDAVVCQNDEMGAGVSRLLPRLARELDRPELAEVPILGGDGLPDRGRQWVDKGLLAATVCVTLPGASAVDLLARSWSEGTPIPAITRLAPEPYPTASASLTPEP